MDEQTPQVTPASEEASIDEAVAEAVVEEMVEEAVEEAAAEEALEEAIEEAVEAVEADMEETLAVEIAEELVADGANPQDAAEAAIEIAEEIVTPEMAQQVVAEAIVEAVIEEALEETVEAVEEAMEETVAEAIAEELVAEGADPIQAAEVAIEVAEELVTPEMAEAAVVEAIVEETIAEEAAEEAVAEAPAAADEAPAAEEPVVEEPPAYDPMKGPGDWYVVHTYAGYENKVKTNLGSRIQSMQMQGKIFDIHIPMEDVMEIKGGKKQIVKKKVFPGYLLVKMIYDNDSWYVVRNTPGVTGFVSSGTGTKPTPLSRKEVEKILVVEKEVVKPTFRLEFEEGDVVRIISGPFADFNGTINEINIDQSKLKVLVNIFDRETPVELGFDQVAKV
jgi:transcriptional antiterminator NusG